LLRLLYLEERPTSGKINLGKFDFSKIRKNQIPSLRRHVGVAFQDSRLIPERTAAQNVALALEVAGKRGREISRGTDDALKLAGIWHKRNNYPGQLSGGEAQRVALARAMANEPMVLLADEPTGNLDEQNALELFTLLREYNQRGATIILATHQIGLAQRFDIRTLHLVSGVIEKDLE
jgi:cell division transport system ATP-binding protein